MVSISYLVWAILRALITVAFIYECYCIGEEITIAAKEENFNLSQTFVMATHMYDKDEVVLFIMFFAVTVGIWLI